MKPSIPSRRALIVAAGASLLPLRPSLAAGLVATPSQTEGPFYPTSFPADMDNDLVQVRGQAAQAMGTVLHLEGRVLDLNGRPVEGALVEIWQCDAQGLYDHPRQPGRERRDSAFKVATASGGLLTSQFYIAGEPGNERDGVFRGAVRDPRQRERIEMKLAPAPGLEAGALATTMDIVVG
jgi:protocatechuate 3,4-dioxygenase beta subunit